MDEETIQRSIQFPKALFEDLLVHAKDENLSFSAVVREACIQYLNTNIPGYCPKCHHNIIFKARYCSNCGQPITEEAKAEINSVIDYLRIMPEFQELMREMELKMAEIFENNWKLSL
jgi:hypothetical protein